MEEPLCCDYYQQLRIPHSFKIANQLYKVEIQDLVFDDNGDSVFGLHDSITSTISVATRIKRGENYYTLQDEQIKNSYWHEVFHAFNWFWNNNYDEALSQTFANFMRELESTKE